MKLELMVVTNPTSTTLTSTDNGLYLERGGD